MGQPVQKAHTLVYALVGMGLGVSPLSDVDLGWHLAGGLWMLDHWSVPSADPFTAGAPFWLCYSWLFELLLAVFYSVGGFPALLLLKCLLVTMLCVVLGKFIEFLGREAQVESPLFDIGLFLLAIPMIAPVLALRPQVLSLVFALWLLRLSLTRASFVSLALLTILWANTHVFWVLVPLFVGVVEFLRKTPFPKTSALTLALLVLGLVNPYGWRLFEGMFLYATDHRMAYSLILEFRQLSSGLGYVFWLWLLVFVACLLSAFAYFFGRWKDQSQEFEEFLACLFFFVVFAKASVNQIKYIPLFAVFALPLLRQGLFGTWASARFPTPQGVVSLGLLRGCWVLLVLGVVLLFTLTPVISTEREELLLAAERVAKTIAVSEQAPVVLNEFNHGGWLSLAWYLHRRAGGGEIRTLVDGRTLVMGERRLEAYKRFVHGSERKNALIDDFQPRWALLTSGAAHTERLAERQDWELVWEEFSLSFLRRVSE